MQPRRPLLTFCSPDARRSMPMHNRNDERQQKFDHLPAGLPAQYRRPERTKRQSSPTCTEPRRRNCSITFSAASKLNSSCKSLQQVSCQIKLLYDRSQSREDNLRKLGCWMLWLWGDIVFSSLCRLWTRVAQSPSLCRCCFLFNLIRFHVGVSRC